MPIQTEAQLDHVTLRDLTAKTPFRLQDIHVGSSRSHIGGAKTIVVSQWIVLRQIVNDAVLSLNLSVDERAFVETSPGTNGLVPNILLHSDSNNGASWYSKAAGGLALCALLLAVIAAGAEYWRQQSVLDTIDARIVTARAKAQKVRATIDRLEQRQPVVFQLRTKKSDTSGLLDLWKRSPVFCHLTPG